MRRPNLFSKYFTHFFFPVLLTTKMQSWWAEEMYLWMVMCLNTVIFVNGSVSEHCYMWYISERERVSPGLCTSGCSRTWSRETGPLCSRRPSGSFCWEGWWSRESLSFLPAPTQSRPPPYTPPRTAVHSGKEIVLHWTRYMTTKTTRFSKPSHWEGLTGMCLYEFMKLMKSLSETSFSWFCCALIVKMG